MSEKKDIPQKPLPEVKLSADLIQYISDLTDSGVRLFGIQVQVKCKKEGRIDLALGGDRPAAEDCESCSG